MIIPNFLRVGKQKTSNLLTIAPQKEVLQPFGRVSDNQLGDD